MGGFLIDIGEITGKRIDCTSYSLLIVFKPWVVPNKKREKNISAYNLALVKVLEGILLPGNKLHEQMLIWRISIWSWLTENMDMMALGLGKGVVAWMRARGSGLLYIEAKIRTVPVTVKFTKDSV